jgi:hypothetical protein
MFLGRKGEDNTVKRISELFRTLQQNDDFKFEVIDEYTIKVFHGFDSIKDVEPLVKNKLKKIAFIEDGWQETVDVYEIIYYETVTEFQLVWEYSFP